MYPNKTSFADDFIYATNTSKHTLAGKPSRNAFVVIHMESTVKWNVLMNARDPTMVIGGIASMRSRALQNS